MISRRNLILSVAAAVAMPLIPPIPAMAQDVAPHRASSRLDQLVRSVDPVIDLYNPHTKEVLKERFYTSNGYDESVIRKINWFMRDWRQKEALQFDIRLVWALATLRHAGIRDGNEGRIQVNSAYRTNKTNQLLRSEGLGVAVNSFHLKARACDFVMPGAKIEDLAAYAAWLEIGGTGHYRNRFIHIDSGEHRLWRG